MTLEANFVSKMSKLFGEVRRVDMRIFVQTYFCLYSVSQKKCIQDLYVKK